MCVKVKDLADYVVTKCAREDRPVSNLQLQKILYFLQYVYAAQTNGLLLFDEEFEAWPYGPVMRSVYAEFSGYGGRPIEEFKKLSIKMSDNLNKFVDAGVVTLRQRSPWDLVRISHAPGSPWDVIYKNGEGSRCVIPNSLIINSAVTASRAMRNGG